MGDRPRLYAAAFLRAVATSLLGILLGVFLAARHLPPSEVGLVVGAGLLGAAAAALGVTLGGDRLGRRRTLAAVALLGVAGAAALATLESLPALVAAAFLGMLNGMGRERGASVILDQAILPTTTDDRGRTLGFAWYGVTQDAGHALGSLLAGAPWLLRQWLGAGELASLRWGLGLYGLLMLAAAALAASLSARVEPGSLAARPPTRPRPESRAGLWRLAALFGLDATAGGFLTASLLSLFFLERFGVSEGTVGLLYFLARILNALSHLGAAWLARRIGLVNTMVFTHLPSSLLLVTVALAPSFPVAAALFLLREGLVEMDVPTRQSYVMALVAPQDRTFAAGVTNLVRLAGWAVAPAFAGALMQASALGAPLLVGAGMKVAYDVLLYLGFRGRRPPEEGGRD